MKPKYKDLVYDVLVACANRGAQIPTLKELATFVNCPSRGRISQVMRWLEQHGQIERVIEDGVTVQVVIAETGKATAWREPLTLVQHAHRRQVQAKKAAALAAVKKKPAKAKKPQIKKPAKLKEQSHSFFRTCQFIKNEDTREPIYCGKDTQSGSSYCAEHHKLCHTKIFYAPWGAMGARGMTAGVVSDG